MRAIAIHQYGGPEVLEDVDLPMPEAGDGEVLVRVRAVAVNPADGKWRSGMFASHAPVPFPHVLGYDIAGTIEEEGAGLAPGTRVVAMLNPVTKGGYAEYASVAAQSLAAIPDDMPFETAAAIPTAGLTGLQMIESALDVQAGQRVLITGALGNVGRAAMFAARGRKAHVVAAVRHSRSAEALVAGAAEVAVLGEEWAGAPFDAIVETVGGSAVAALARHLKPGGRIITAATDPIPAEGLSATPEFFAVVPDGAQLSRLLVAVAAGDLPIEIAHVLPLARAAEAQALVDGGGIRGKVILAP